jgi:hypothetical protein
MANRQWIYARKPTAEVGPENFDLRDSPMPQQGKLKAPVDIVDGFEKMPSALAGMFAGKNKGKLMVKV